MMNWLRLVVGVFLIVAAFSAEQEGELEDKFGDGEDCGCKMSRDSVTHDPPIDSIQSTERTSQPLQENMVLIPGGKGFIGIDKPVLVRDGEGPRRKVMVSPFYMDTFAVTNQDFDKFIRETGFSTENERFGWSFVFHAAIPKEVMSKTEQAVLGAEWWLPVNGSTWKWPEGPQGQDVFSSGRAYHPVVQVTWNDAVAYCTWRNARLPTEAEWEIAASGPERRTKRTSTRFPWGNELTPNRTHRMNVFQGNFPVENTIKDGYEFTSPVNAFEAQNGYGLYNMLGNVWEWVSDWWTIDHSFEDHWEVPTDPQGPATGKDKVKKGGSIVLLSLPSRESLPIHS